MFQLDGGVTKRCLFMPLRIRMEGIACLSTLMNICIALPCSGAPLPLLILGWLLFRIYQTIKYDIFFFSPWFFVEVFPKRWIERGQVLIAFHLKNFWLFAAWLNASVKTVQIFYAFFFSCIAGGSRVKTFLVWYKHCSFLKRKQNVMSKGEAMVLSIGIDFLINRTPIHFFYWTKHCYKHVSKNLFIASNP